MGSLHFMAAVELTILLMICKLLKLSTSCGGSLNLMNRAFRVREASTEED